MAKDRYNMREIGMIPGHSGRANLKGTSGDPGTQPVVEQRLTSTIPTSTEPSFEGGNPAGDCRLGRGTDVASLPATSPITSELDGGFPPTPGATARKAHRTDPRQRTTPKVVARAASVVCWRPHRSTSGTQMAPTQARTVDGTHKSPGQRWAAWGSNPELCA